MTEISKAFWGKLMEYEKEISGFLAKRSNVEYKNAMNIITGVKTSLKIDDCIICCFGIGVRNGLVLPERENHIELIISPQLRKDIALLNDIYGIHKEYIPANWSVIRYKFHQPSMLDTITIYYNDTEISKNDFEYHPILENDKLNILLFVDDKIANFMIKKENIKLGEETRDIWIPKDNSIYSIITSAIGEYALFNIIDKMEIYLKSEHTDIKREPLSHMSNTVEMILNNPTSDINKCFRCNYTSVQTHIRRCKCKKAYYCDVVCQKAHHNLHKSICK